MKTIVLAAALAVTMGVSTAMADDGTSTSFYALSALSADKQTTLAGMTDPQLAAAVGGKLVRVPTRGVRVPTRYGVRVPTSR